MQRGSVKIEVERLLLGCRLAGAKCRGSVLPAVAGSAEVLHLLEVQRASAFA